MDKKIRRQGNFLILGTAFLWSFLGILTKSVPYHGMTVAGATSFMAMLVMFFVNRKHRFRRNALVLATGLVTAVMNLSFFIANKYTTVANAIVLQYCSPIFVVLYYRFFQNKKLKKQQLLAVGICFAGLLVFFANQLGHGNMFGNLLALFSGICFAGVFYLGALPGNDPVASQLLSHAVCAAAGLGYTVLWVNQPYDLKQTGFLLLGGFLCSGFSGVLYAWGIQRTTALNANLIAMSEVIMAPLWSFLIFREAFDGPAALGAGLMLTAILYETWFEARDLA